MAQTPEDFDVTQPDSWPDTHISGQARDLADRLSDITLETLAYVYDIVIEGGEDRQDTEFMASSLTLYQLIINDDYMLASATETTVDGKGSWDHVASLRDHCLEDRDGDAFYYFDLRLRQRLEEGG